MSAIVKAALAHLGYNEDQLLSSRETEDSVIFVIDLGIAGCPKHTVAKADIKPIKAEMKAPAKKAASKKDAN